MTEQFDVISKPEHYNTHPSGVECIEITRHMGYNLGNAFKYLYRYGEKDNPVVDLGKSLQYIEFEEQRRAQYPFAHLFENRNEWIWLGVRDLAHRWHAHTASPLIRVAGLEVVSYDLDPQRVRHNFPLVRELINKRINELKGQSNDNS